MNFFGIGGWEWVVIAVAALVIFGPGKLPEVAGQAGRAVRDFRRMTNDLTGEFEKSLNESGAGELKKSFDKELRGMRGQVESVGKSVERDLKKGTATTTSAKKTTTGGKSTTSAKKAASKSGSTTTGSGAARTAATGKSTTTAAKTAKSTASVERKATKADPLADVSFMDEGSVRAAAAAPRKAATTTKLSSRGAATATERPEVSGGSALVRARERRINAGYGRAHMS